MKYFGVMLLLGLMLGACTDAPDTPAGDATVDDATMADTATQAADDDGWISLFDGESLEGWRASENPESFTVEDGRIVVNGPRSHLFYTGPVENADFKNFEFRADVMTEPGANSGIYFHTEYQDGGWPSQGYEVQVNNSYESDPRKTGSLYAVEDVEEAPAEDNEWFTEQITVRDSLVTIQVNGETTVEFVQPADYEPPSDMAGRVLSSGTFALQAHDPDSKVYFRNIMVRPLPD